MGSRSDDRLGKNRYHETIADAKEAAALARSQLRSEMLSGSVSTQTKLEAARAIEDFRDMLDDYRDEDALSKPWNQWTPSPDTLDEFIGRTVVQQQALPRRGSPTQQSRVPAIAAVDAKQIIEVGKILDKIAKDLGFAAEAKQERSFGAVGGDDRWGGDQE